MKYVDPDGRRELTDEEKKDIQKLRDQAKGKSADDAKKINDAADAIVKAIKAVRPGHKDPVPVRIVLNAIHQIGNPRYGNAGALQITRNGITIGVGSGDNKCNIFVCAMHALGRANLGLGPNGYPVVLNPNGLTVPPSANQLGNANINLNHLVVIAGSAQMGDIVAFPTTHGQGHSSIALSGDVIVYASGSDVRVNTI